MHANICDTVFSLPQKFAGNIHFCWLFSNLMQKTKNSLVKVIKTIHTFIKCRSKKHKKAAVVSILSARGSKNFPISVIKLYFLAIYPSTKSVIDAITNSIRAKIM